jgi:hypothetical protein
VLRLAAVVAAVAAVCAVVASASVAHSTRVYRTGPTPPFQTGVVDPWAFASSVGSQEAATAFGKVKSSGASVVRLIVSWQIVAPQKPAAASNASDPTWPGYKWSGIDQVVSAAEAQGLTPLLDVTHAPGWALKVKAKGVNAGTPDPNALTRFGTALATHFDGNHGAPAVHDYQVWNEPNLSLDLSPVKPATYRKLVNDFADAVHAIDPSNVVVAGALEPFGHPKIRHQTWYSVSPLTFMRSMLCVSAGAHPHSTCKTKIHFDVWSHHPYTFEGPFGHAKEPNDVSLGDLPKMRSVLKAAVKMHHIVSSRPVQFWVTEFSWDTNPPQRKAAPIKLQARWTSEALYQMWKSGITLATWYLLQDRPLPSPYESGLYFGGKPLAKARAKPTLTAFRVPFVAYLHGRTVQIWGRDATSTKQVVTIQRRHGSHGKWQTVAQVRSNPYGIFKATLRLKATKKDWLRASAPDSGNSLAFSLTVPKPHRWGPWGNP